MRINLETITPRQMLTIAKELCDYQYIMDNWEKNDEDFQEVYYNCYLKARWPIMNKTNNKKIYFDKLQMISPTEDFMDIVAYLKKEIGSYEVSFASKMLHTKNASMPIYDKKVREYLSKEENVEFWWQRSESMSGKSAPRGTPEFDKIKHDWVELCCWYERFLKSFDGQQWIEWFDINFPTYKEINNVKKIDFIIFATN